MRSSSGLSIFLLLLACASPAHSQEAGLPPALLEPPAATQGYYFALGLHGGAVSAIDDGDVVKPLGGFTGALHIGQEVMRWMDLGLVLEGGPVISRKRSGSLVSLGIEWTIRPASELFIRLGCGVGANQLSAAKNSDNRASAFGAAAAITLGYAWFPFREARESGGWSISPVIRAMSVQPFSEDAAFWATAGFEVALWTGLPKQQLDLRLEDAFPAQRTMQTR